MLSYTPVLPTTLLDRAVWLNDLRLEGAIAGMMAAYQDVVGLIRLLLLDIEEQEFSPVPQPIFKRLMDLAIARPEVLVVELFRVRWSPRLLADLLLYGSNTFATAASFSANMTSSGSLERWTPYACKL